MAESSNVVRLMGGAPLLSTPVALPEWVLVRYTRREWRRECFLDARRKQRERRRVPHTRRQLRALLRAAHAHVAGWSEARVREMAQEACRMSGEGLHIASFPTRAHGVDVVVTPDGVFRTGPNWEFRGR